MPAERQRTLRATIAWSPSTSRQGRAAVCSPRVELLCGQLQLRIGGGGRGADLDTLHSLLDKSLVRRRDGVLGPRYWMLETIREYAGEQLKDDGRAEEFRLRHANWHLVLAEEILSRGSEGRFRTRCWRRSTTISERRSPPAPASR